MRTWLYLAGLAGCLFALGEGYGILTKSMIRTGDAELENRRYEPVKLFIKDNVTNEIVTDSKSEETTSREGKLEDYDADEGDNEDDDEDDEEDDEEEEEQEEENDENKINDEDVDEKRQLVDEVTDMTTTTPVHRRTRLYPVGRLWEKTSPDIWSILSTAMHCIWSGLGMDCFTFRVMPMVKSMMGYHYSGFEPPFYLTSREDDSTEVVEGRRRRRHQLLGLLKILKGALAGAIGFKTLLIPVLGVLALLAGKSLMLSFTSVLISAAAAWTGMRFSADRRYQSALPDNTNAQYYMM